MTKYFSVDISNDIHIINLYETLEQARGACLAGAVGLTNLQTTWTNTKIMRVMIYRMPFMVWF